MSPFPAALALEARSDRHAEELRLLARAVAPDGGPFEDRVLRALVEGTGLLGYEHGTLSRIEGETRTVIVAYAPGTGLEAGSTLPLEDTFCGLTLRRGDLLEIDYAGRSLHRTDACRETLGIESYLGVPVRVDGAIWGTLSFSSWTPRCVPPTEADRDLVRLLAMWAGAAIEGERREQALAEQQTYTRTVVDHAPVVLFETDAEGRITRCEGAGLAGLGLAPGELVGEDLFELCAESSVTAESLRRVLGGEAQTWRGSLGDVHFVTHARPIRGPQGRLTGLVGLSFDLTDQRRAEVVARSSLERFRAVAASAADAIVTTDARGTITSWNAAATRIFGYEAGAAVGQPVSLILPPGSRDAHGEGAAGGRSPLTPDLVGRTVRLEGRRASGETFPLDVSLSSWGDGEAAEFAAILRDVSEQVARERALAESEERFRALSEASFEGIAYSEGGVITDCNEQFAWLFGYARVEDMVGRAATELCAPEHVGKVLEMNGENRTGSYEVVCVRRDGSRFWAELQGRSAPIDGRAARITAIRDVTTRKRIEEQRRFQADVLAHVSDAVVALDLDGRITYWNAGAEALHGHHANEVLGRRLEDVVTYLVPDSSSGSLEVSSAPEAALQSAAAAAGELNYVGPNGGRRFVSVSSSVLRDEDGGERGLLAVARDVTAQRELSARLRHQATHDVLTGLPNRALFRQRIHEAIAEGGPFAVLFVDLDHFKVVNDSLGHDAGDRLLMTIALRIRGVLGAYEGSVVARLGGDEFGVLVPTTGSDPEAVGHRVLQALDAPVDLGPRAVTPAASVGVVPGGERYACPDALLRDADTAMYAAKHGGRRRLVRFDGAMHEAANLRFGLEHDLRHAIERGQLRAYLQPVVSLGDGAVVRFEARVRWAHPDHGLLLPGQFLDVAEEIGLVADIDRWILDEACRTAGPWIAAAGLSLSVNCSDRAFQAEGLAERVRAAVDACGLPPRSLTLALTEHALAGEGPARRAVEAVRQQGLRLEAKDFGADRSSLQLLRETSIDALKVDRSFVADLPGSPSSHAIVRAILGLAADLGVEATADGVETVEQLRAVRALGAREAQGYLFSEPVPVVKARALLRTRPWARAWRSWTAA